MFPQWSQFMLTSDIPDGEFYVLVFQRFNIEPDGGNGLNELVLLQFEEDRGLARAVKAEGNHPHLDLWADVNAIVLQTFW